MVSNESCPNTTCNDALTVNEDGKPATSIIMFWPKEHRSRSSVFCILVTGLALTDLLGTCLLSPSVFICYARNMSLISLGDRKLCNLFGFAMSFFGLAPTLILCAMAVERCLAISHPYFYSVHIRRSFAKFALFFIYVFSLAFCLLPFGGYGKFRQYCPGTWCFIDMDATGDEQASLVLAFSVSYSSLMALLIFAVFVCNGSVIVSLCQMHRSQMMRRGSVGTTVRRRRLSLAWFGRGEEEMDHLVLLALITVIFVVCSLPLTRSVPNLTTLEDWSGLPLPEGKAPPVLKFEELVGVYGHACLHEQIAGFINAIHPFCDDTANLTAFRFYALNPIVDPWVFIICRKSVFRHLCSLLSCQFTKGALDDNGFMGPQFQRVQRSGPQAVHSRAGHKHSSLGQARAQEGSRAWVSGPVLSRTRKWTQPQERRKARMAGGEGEARVELEEELTEVLKGRKLGLQLVEQRLLPPLERRRHGPRAQRHNNDGGGEHGQPSQPEQQHQPGPPAATSSSSLVNGCQESIGSGSGSGMSSGADSEPPTLLDSPGPGTLP
ncbi:hypothetical protein INR49_031284 [Caranx melampygus]|nr:hypothetical protein INR49_031284 [Caranx melampygus]